MRGSSNNAEAALDTMLADAANYMDGSEADSLGDLSDFDDADFEQFADSLLQDSEGMNTTDLFGYVGDSGPGLTLLQRIGAYDDDSLSDFENADSDEDADLSALSINLGRGGGRQSMVVGNTREPITPQMQEPRTLRRGQKGVSFALDLDGDTPTNDGYLDSVAPSSENSSMAGDFSAAAAADRRPESTFSNMSLGPPLSPIDFDERRASMFEGSGLPGNGAGGGNRVSIEGTPEISNVAMAGRKESAGWAGMSY